MPDLTFTPQRKPSVSAALLGAAILLSGPAPGAAEETGLRVWGEGTAAGPPEIRVLQESESGVQFEFTLPSVTIEEVALGGGDFQRLRIPGGGERGGAGEPELPVFTRLLAVPDGRAAHCTATVLEEEERSGFRVVPAQDETMPGFAYDREAYARDDFGSAPLVELGGAAILRGVRVMPMTIAPLRCNPAQGAVRAARRLRVEVAFAGEDPINPHPARAVPPSPSFERIYRDLVLNRSGSSDKAAAGDGLWLLICKNDQNVLDRLQPLIDWRKRKGHKVYVATTAETGTTKESIKDFIQTAYSYWPDPPEYVALAGDAGGSYGIPTWHENVSGYNGEGDHPYVQLDGGDLLADAHVGRLSFSTLTELETIVAKMVNYESNPYLSDTAWFTRSCLVGDPIDSGYSTVMTMQWIKRRQLQLGYTQVDTVFNEPFVSQMATDLNRGDTYFFYRGIQGMSGWGNSNTYTLTNGWKLPFCVIITCDTGSFETGTSRSEGFLRAGSATNPRGGIGAVGTATTGTHTKYNNCYMFGVGWGAFYNDAWQMGAAHTWGKLNLFLNYGAAQYGQAMAFSYWNNLMGDPAGEIWTAAPEAIAVTHPPSLPVGANFVPVEVTASGLPLAGARVCLYQAGGFETQVVGYTDASGRAELTLPPAVAGTMQLTVTRHDSRPYLANLPVTAGSYVGYQAHGIDDDGADESRGNGDGLVSPGEWIELPVQLQNYGSSAANGVTAALSSADPYVTILDAAEDYGDLGAGQTAASSDDFGFRVARDCPDGHLLRFLLAVQAESGSWESAFAVEAHAPALEYESHHFSNDGGNGLLDPGETVGLYVRLYNSGDLEAEGVQASLVSWSQYITVQDPLGAYPVIIPGASQENSANLFTVTASAGCPDGYSAPMQLFIETVGAVRDTVSLLLPVGTAVTTDPLGPDAYGYWGFDNTDAGYADAPVYSWVEIAPGLGGDGTQVQLGDYSDFQDKSRTVALPFPFRYYGQLYTTATICSNGWLVMGNSYLTDYRNWTLPSPGGPDGAIAPFWDDLVEVNNPAGHVYQKTDATGHRWIVEWSRMRNIYNQQTETFQAILYDPAFHPTDTGDGIIDFQYSTVSNTDISDGYATVGIERPDNSDGLTYTYFNRYPAAAPTLAAGRAIRFLPHRESPAAAGPAARVLFGFDPTTPNPLRAGGAIRFTLPGALPASLEIFDVAGRRVRTLLMQAPLPAGAHAAAWDGTSDRRTAAPPGAYFLRLEAGGETRSRKILYLAE